MVKFDLNKLDGAFGVGLLGSAVVCFLVYMVCNIVSNLGLIDLAEYLGHYMMIAGVICIAVGSGLLVLNAFRSRSTETEGIPLWQILIIFCVVGVLSLVSVIVVAAI